MSAADVIVGIPTNAVLAVLGTLGLLVYRDVIRRIEDNAKQTKALRREGNTRTRAVLHMQVYQRLICNKMGIEYTDAPVDNADVD